MALIRCPNCDTLHDLDDAFLASGRRKVRCASCRTIWEAAESESDPVVTIALPLPQRNTASNAVQASVADEPVAGASETEGAALDQSAIDAMDFGPEPAPAEAEAASVSAGENGEDGKEISADELEALFADEAAPAGDKGALLAEGAEAAAGAAAAEAHADKDFDPASLALAQDMAAAAAASAGVAQGEPGERRARRGGKPAKIAKPKAASGGRAGMMAAMVMAASLGTLSTLVLLRQETVRLFPGSAKVFDVVGLSASARGLDITEVNSQMVSEDGRDVLEVTGKIVNNARKAEKVPVLRLSIRGNAGNEVYVWTATAEQTDLGPGESTRFHRRLASPPQDSQSVLVRFVAKDDIVAAVR